MVSIFPVYETLTKRTRRMMQKGGRKEVSSEWQVTHCLAETGLVLVYQCLCMAGEQNAQGVISNFSSIL